MHMKGQTGPIRVNRGTYPRLQEPYENHREAFGPIWARGGHWVPVDGLDKAKWDKRDLIRSLKGSIGNQDWALQNPLGKNSFLFLSILSFILWILFCFILMFSFITFSSLTQNQRYWSFSNREDKTWYF